MSANYFKILMTSKHLSEKEMSNIPSPRTEVHLNMISKSTSLASTLGLFLSGPIAILITKKPVMSSIYQITSLAWLGGLVAAPVITEAMLQRSGATADSIYQKALTNRYDYHKMRVDRGAVYGMFFGAASTVAFKGPVLGSVAIGCGAGTIAGLAFEMGAVEKPPWVKNEYNGS